MNKKLLDIENLFQNVYFWALLVLFTTMYGPRLSPKLPNRLKNLFDNILFRGIVLFLIVYMANKNFLLSLVIAIIFLVTMNILNSQNVIDSFKKAHFIKTYENFISSDSSPTLTKCDTYNKEKFEKTGTPFAPINQTKSLY